MEDSVNSFLQHLVVEKGFSRNTLDAYRNDLGQFEGFLRERLMVSFNGEGSWRSVDLNLLNEYIADLRVRKGYRDATTARKIAAIKSFFGFLAANGNISEDPTDSLGSPRVGRTLPKCMSEEEVKRLLGEAAKAGTSESQRDAAILEVAVRDWVESQRVGLAECAGHRFAGILSQVLGQRLPGAYRLSLPAGFVRVGKLSFRSESGITGRP